MSRIVFYEFLLVGAGGFFGSGLRYVVATGTQRLFPYSSFPYGTVTVNLVGCFLIGYVFLMLETRELFDPALTLFLLAGVLGGFTTFSAFSLENLLLVQDSKTSVALLNIGVQVIAGFLAAWAGMALAKLL